LLWLPEQIEGKWKIEKGKVISRDLGENLANLRVWEGPPEGAALSGS
jgi:hypothetical protein